MRTLAFQLKACCVQAIDRQEWDEKARGGTLCLGLRAVDDYPAPHRQRRP